MTAPAVVVDVRAARGSDVAEIVRLGETMYESVGLAGDAQWRATVQRELTRRLGGHDLLGWVVDADDGGLAGCGLMSVMPRIPYPGESATVSGLLQWVATDERFRRRGIGAAITLAAMDAAAREGIEVVSLHASPAGRLLYENLGFRAHPNVHYPTDMRGVPMVWRAPRQPD